MSAFIVESHTISYILHVLYRCEITPPMLKAIDEPHLVRKLYTLNVKAVNCRYGERTRIKPFIAQPITAETCSPQQGIKSLGCYLYQCAECDFPDAKLFKQLSALNQRLRAKLTAKDVHLLESRAWGHGKEPDLEKKDFELIDWSRFALTPKEVADSLKGIYLSDADRKRFVW